MMYDVPRFHISSLLLYAVQPKRLCILYFVNSALQLRTANRIIKQGDWIEAEIKGLQKIEQELPPLRQLKLSEFKLLSRFKQERKLVKTCIILSLHLDLLFLR